MSKKFEKIIIDNNDLYQFKITMLLINESSKSIKDTIKNASSDFSNRYKNLEVRKVLCDYAELTVEYMHMQSYVVSIYSTFEQYVKMLFNIKNIKKFYEENLYYSFKDNSYYEIINQCRLLNNAIKHGTMTKELDKKYINKFSATKNNTVLDNSLNIELEHIGEFCYGVIKGVEELINHYKDMGMYEEKS